MFGLKPIKSDKFYSTIILIRVMVGAVFFSEGIQKFLYPSVRGVGRFIKIGLPAPEVLAYLVASIEVLCGILILVGLITRIGAIPLIVIMLVAMMSTKVPILVNDGFWQMAHAARTDFSMLLGSLFLFLNGGGTYSLDAYRTTQEEDSGSRSEHSEDPLS
jgi:uncharacterized membrane protein YphA (DoxX/SURF4 family)